MKEVPCTLFFFLGKYIFSTGIYSGFASKTLCNWGFISTSGCILGWFIRLTIYVEKATMN